MGDDYFIWPDSIENAKKIQTKLKDKVKIVPFRKKPKYIAGVDAAFCDNKVLGISCLYKYPEITLTEYAFGIKEASLPYIPGYLSFREGPAIIEALKKLKFKPDVVLFDGQGIAHPMGLGIASHIGVIIKTPTIGCAKSRLVGEYNEPGCKKGVWSPLKYNGKTVGAVLRTRDNVRPVFVSPGHLIDLKTSIEMVLSCTGKYRIPEPLRRADTLSREVKHRM
ncbi:MAG: endonuclease V [Nitrospirae bacterium]|jgi:deoxyribonuclease V|nr:endonuclease V [Nitrospirota bacterium]